MAFYRLFYVRLGYIGLGDCPTGLEPPAGARNRRKVTVKNTKNHPLRCVATKGAIPKSFIIISYTDIIREIFGVRNIY